MAKVRRERGKIVTILILMVIVAASLVFIAVNQKEKLLHQDKIYAVLEITNKSGFALNDTALIFGRLTPGTSSTKNVTLTNIYDFGVNVYFSYEGTIAPYLIEEPPIYLEKGESRSVIFETVDITENDSLGTYDGYLIIKFKKA